MGRKRRGSQAFTFDQSEETLKQNESIVNLYQNKTFQPPEPQPIETINEEGDHEQKQNQRSKRGVVSSPDGTLVLGSNKSLRQIQTYKFWKQDDKERNRRRKMMITKLWKGRKRKKILPLPIADEQKLIDLIADRVSSDDEEQSSPSKPKFNLQSDNYGCVWKSTEPSSKTKASITSCSSSDIDVANTCVWSNRDDARDVVSEADMDVANDVDEDISKEHFVEVNDEELLKKSVLEENKENCSDETLLELHHLIPKSELDELLETDALLFCNDQAKPKEVLGTITNIQQTGNNAKDHRKSIRRSARLASIPNIIGSVFTTTDENSENDINKVPVKKKRNRRFTPKSAEAEDAVNQQSSQDVSEPGTFLNVPQQQTKKRRSYSFENSSGRYSLDGSKKNSLLTVTGDMEINISLPESVRRSLSADVISFNRPLVLSPSPLPAESSHNSFERKNLRNEKVVLPVPVFKDSDSEDDEVIISGIFGKKTLKSRSRVKVK